MPVVLIKDEATDRVFDTSHLRDVPYEKSLRIDSVQPAIIKLADALTATFERKDNDTNSLIKILGIKPAKAPDKKEIGPETAILLDAIRNISYRLDLIESTENQLGYVSQLIDNDKIKAIEYFKDKIGSKINHEDFGTLTIMNIGDDGQIRARSDNRRLYKIDYPYTNVSF